MNRIAPRLIVAAVAATFALAGCGRDEANRPGSTTGATGGTASSPTTPGTTPSPSGSGSAMSGGGAAPSGSANPASGSGTSSPSGTMSGTTPSDTGAATPGTTPSAGTGTTGSGPSGAGTSGTGSTGTTGTGTSGSTGTTGTGTTGTGTTGGTSGSSSTNQPGSTTPGKSSSLGTHIAAAQVQLVADTTTSGKQSSMKLSSSDKEFIQEAASGGLAEVEAGKMVAERARHPGVKQFAETLVKDHTAANEELRRIAASTGVSLPATPEGKHRRMIEKLANEKGPDLERTFVHEFGVKDHEKDIKAFQKQAQQGDNAELKTFAANTLPKLQEHYAMAQKLENDLGK